MENSDYPDHLAKLKKNIAGELQKKSLAKSNSFESEDLSDDEYSYYSSSEESAEKKSDHDHDHDHDHNENNPVSTFGGASGIYSKKLLNLTKEKAKAVKCYISLN